MHKDLDEQWLSLTIADDFMFGKVMQDKSLCTELIQIILPELDIERIEFPERQKSFNEGLFSHGVRFDVYTRTGKGEIIDVEMQMANTGNLPKRTRAYHAMITGSEMDAGKMNNYNDIHKAFVIFICMFDLFKKGRHIYTFRNICREDTSIELDDGTVTVFLNAKGTMDDVSPRLKNFLEFAKGNKSDDPFISRMEAKMNEVMMSPEMKLDYFETQERLNRSRDEGRLEGKIEGRFQAKLEIVKRMRNAGISDEQICDLTGLSPEDIAEL